MGIHLSLEWSWMIFNLLIKGFEENKLINVENLIQYLHQKRQDKHFLLTKKYTIILISYGPIFLFKTNTFF